MTKGKGDEEKRCESIARALRCDRNQGGPFNRMYTVLETELQSFVIYVRW